MGQGTSLQAREDTLIDFLFWDFLNNKGDNLTFYVVYGGSYFSEHIVGLKLEHAKCI